MTDSGLVRAAGPIHQVAGGYHADHLFTIQNRQMPDAMLGHRSQTFFGGNHAIGHDLPHLGFFGRTVLQNDFARLIALGNDADQTAFGQKPIMPPRSSPTSGQSLHTRLPTGRWTTLGGP